MVWNFVKDIFYDVIFFLFSIILMISFCSDFLYFIVIVYIRENMGLKKCF